MYLGIGVKLEGGKNSGQVYTELFSADNFITSDGRNIFGDRDTWNFGDNTTIVFNASLYASSLARKSGSNANANNVHNAYNQVADENRTYGVFINSVEYSNKETILETFIYDVTNELPDLIEDQVYSSYRKGLVSNDRIAILSETSTNLTQIENTTIFVEEPEQTITTTDFNTAISANSYKGNYYYFGIWKSANALYDIEKNYFVK